MRQVAAQDEGLIETVEPFEDANARARPVTPVWSDCMNQSVRPEPALVVETARSILGKFPWLRDCKRSSASNVASFEPQICERGDERDGSGCKKGSPMLLSNGLCSHESAKKDCGGSQTIR